MYIGAMERETKCLYLEEEDRVSSLLFFFLFYDDEIVRGTHNGFIWMMNCQSALSLVYQIGSLEMKW